ncbi:hypothetical protein ALC60_13148 [Trachymyrmex zeteki]|uniref:Uncharacterized protein n=1 Tax=Mycetomoellerius zeteki TaxID=64791 RepID=A0A151WIZ4_9HYME|nr:hypothetical protein ALC60_13148 [Trachymyrmex zeteki]
METRSKKTVTDPNAEACETKTRELTTREFETQQIERGIQERERRLNQQEAAYEKLISAMEIERRNLDRKRDKVASKIKGLESREKEMERKWQDSEASRLEDSATNVPNETKPPLVRNFSLPPARGNYTLDNAPSPKVSFKEATDSVAYFDGYNIPLAQFTRACRRAREIIPPSGERNLTKLLINKLGKRAYYAVEDEPCNSITDLIDLLTDTFGTA